MGQQQPIAQQPTEEKWTFPDAVHSRPDMATAKLVDKGISFQYRYGTDYAAEFLKSNRIAIDVAMRVLARPSERRKYSQESK